MRQPLGSTQKPPISLLLSYGQSSLLQPECALKNVIQNMSHTHTYTHWLKTLQDFHPLTFRIKSRFPPITHQGQHDLTTVSDLLPDIIPFPPAHPALHTLALAYPDLRAFMLVAHSAWTWLSLLLLPLGWLFSSNWFLLEGHPLGEAFSAHKNLKTALHPSSIFQSLPWLYFHRRTHLSLKTYCILIDHLSDSPPVHKFHRSRDIVLSTPLFSDT